MLVANLYGGPGIGKSSLAAQVFGLLKWKGISAELVTEYAKSKVWEDAPNILNDQLYVFAKQRHALFVLNGKVDIAITDSPILLSLVYGKNEPEEFKKCVLAYHRQYKSLNFLLTRTKPYVTSGRLQTELEAVKLDSRVKDMLTELDEPYEAINASSDTSEILAKKIVEYLEAQHVYYLHKN